MALHARQQIREAVRAQIVNSSANTLAGSRVYETRIVPYEETELPAIAVYTGTESVDPGSWQTAPRTLKRELSLVVEAAVKTTGSGNIDDAMDAIAAEIECAMWEDDTFGGKADHSLLESTELDIADLGGKFIGLVRLTYSVTYYTDDSDCAPTLLPFSSADVHYKIAPAQATADQREDIVTVPT